MTPPPTVALEACPFCGAHGKEIVGAGTPWRIEHKESCFWGGTQWITEEAIAAWNQRHAATPKPVECEPCPNCNTLDEPVVLAGARYCRNCGCSYWNVVDILDATADCQPSVAEGERDSPFTRCTFEGPPPAPHKFWSDWAASDQYVDVKITAHEYSTAQPAAPSALTDAQREACEAGARFIEHVTSRAEPESANQRTVIEMDKRHIATLRDLAQRGR